MIKDYKISVPFFEFGPKAYLYGEELLKLMKKIDGFAEKYDMDVIADVKTLPTASTYMLSIWIAFPLVVVWAPFFPKLLKLPVR